MNTKKVKKIFLENYSSCKSEEADLIIYPISKDGEAKVPELYLKRKEPLNTILEVTEDLIWTPYMRFNVGGSQEIYNKSVDWWFDNMNDNFKDSLLSIAEKSISEGFDISISVKKARNWLKIRAPKERKSVLGKFLSNWIIKGSSIFLSRRMGETLYR